LSPPVRPRCRGSPAPPSASEGRAGIRGLRPALDPTDALAIGVAVWLEQVAASQLGAVALAAPVLKRHSHGRPGSRQVRDFGLE